MLFISTPPPLFWLLYRTIRKIRTAPPITYGFLNCSGISMILALYFLETVYSRPERHTAFHHDIASAEVECSRQFSLHVIPYPGTHQRQKTLYVADCWRIGHWTDATLRTRIILPRIHVYRCQTGYAGR